MEKYFKQAIQRMRSLKEIVSESEWNDIAKEENLLSAWSIEYIAQKIFAHCRKK